MGGKSKKSEKSKKSRRSLVTKFCGCIKKVRNTIKVRKGTKEEAAIAVCTKSVLQTKGKTLKKFTCRNGKLITQKMR